MGLTVGGKSRLLTADHRIAMAYMPKQQVIVALRGIDEPDLAGRLERCKVGFLYSGWARSALPHKRLPDDAGSAARNGAAANG
jgi:hypothetical protein